MNALKSMKLREKKEREAQVRRAVEREYKKIYERDQNDRIETSRYNALLHVLHVFCLLNKEFGFGKKRLKQLLEAMENADKQFKADLEDGIAWTKILKYLDNIGFVFEVDRKYVENSLQQRYESGVKRNGGSQK